MAAGAVQNNRYRPISAISLHALPKALSLARAGRRRRHESCFDRFVLLSAAFPSGLYKTPPGLPSGWLPRTGSFSAGRNQSPLSSRHHRLRLRREGVLPAAPPGLLPATRLHWRTTHVRTLACQRASLTLGRFGSLFSVSQEPEARQTKSAPIRSRFRATRSTCSETRSLPPTSMHAGSIQIAHHSSPDRPHGPASCNDCRKTTMLHRRRHRVQPTLDRTRKEHPPC